MANLMIHGVSYVNTSFHCFWFLGYHYGISVSITDIYAKDQMGWLHVEVIGTKGSVTKEFTKNADSSK